jgi:hypothetical protein
MKHHEENEQAKYDYIYYLVGLIAGVLTGAVLDVGMLWALVGGVLGLLTAALFLNVLVKGREDI